MSYTLADLALARRHVEEAAERIARQRALISRMDEAGHGTGDAWTLLGLFEDTAEQMRIHLVEIEAQLTDAQVVRSPGGTDLFGGGSA